MLNHVEDALLDLKPMTREIFIAVKFRAPFRREIAERTGIRSKAPRSIEV